MYAAARREVHGRVQELRHMMDPVVVLLVYLGWLFYSHLYSIQQASDNSEHACGRLSLGPER